MKIKTTGTNKNDNNKNNNKRQNRLIEHTMREDATFLHHDTKTTSSFVY